MYIIELSQLYYIAYCLHIFSEVVLCHISNESLPLGFVPSNFSMEFVCVLTTREGNHILGCCFVVTLVLQTGYVLWRLFRDTFGKSRIHQLIINSGTQHAIQKVATNTSGVYIQRTAYYI